MGTVLGAPEGAELDVESTCAAASLGSDESFVRFFLRNPNVGMRSLDWGTRGSNLEAKEAI